MSTLEIVTAVVGLVVSTVLPWAGKYLASYLKAKKVSILAQKGLLFVTHIVFDAVKSAQQTAVDGLKEANKDGKLTDKEENKIYDDVWDSVKKSMGPSGWASAIVDIGVDEDGLKNIIDNKIEAAVYDIKANSVNPTQ